MMDRLLGRREYRTYGGCQSASPQERVVTSVACIRAISEAVINKYWLPGHPQVCTPAFDGCQSTSTVMSARRFRGLIRRLDVFAKRRGLLKEYVPAMSMLAQ
jgi:hypothetical protein